jgi:hypothetical protein
MGIARQQTQVEAQIGDRRAQFMRNIGDELGFQLIKLTQSGICLRQPLVGGFQL